MAAFILLICIAPTMRIFTSMYLSQNSIIRENQRDHLAHMTHGKITEMLYKRQIPMDGGLDSRVIPITDPDLNELLQKSFFSSQGTLEIIKSHTPRGKEKPDKYLGKIVVKMKDMTYRPNKNAKPNKVEEKDPSETCYEYIVYVDAGALNDKGKNKNSSPSDPSTDKGSNSAQANDKNALKQPNPAFNTAKKRRNGEDDSDE